MALIGDFHAVALPWPSAPATAEYTAAGGALGLATTTVVEKSKVSSIMSLLSDRIEKFAPEAPAGAKAEAARRYHGYLANSSLDDATEISTDGLNVKFQFENTRAFRLSGAIGVLSPYRVRAAIQTWEDE